MEKTFEVEFTEHYTIFVEADSAEEAIARAEQIDLDDWEFEISDFEATDRSGMSTAELLDWLKNKCNGATPDDIDCFDFNYLKDIHGNTVGLCSDGIQVWGVTGDCRFLESVEFFLEEYINERWYL